MGNNMPVNFEWEKVRELEKTLWLDENDSKWLPLSNIADLQWKIRAIKDDSTLTVLLYVDHADHDRWSYEVDLSSTLLSSNSKPITLLLQSNKNNTNDHPKEHCWIETVPWSEVTHKQCFDPNDESIKLSIRIEILSSTGTNPCRLITFGEETDSVNDVRLVIEGKKIAVSKSYLALHSPYFSTLFFGDFVEKEKEEIDLPGIKYDDVIEILKMIYPSRVKISENNVEGVLHLADLWDISIVRRKADKFLANDVISPTATIPQKVPLAKKVLYASKYALPKLQHALLTAFNKKRVVEVMESEDYQKEYSDTDRVYLLKRFKNLTT